jgi:hypothetical protein
VDSGPGNGQAQRMDTSGLRRLLHTQEQLWDRHLAGYATSGRQARAAVGEPPLRWSGGRLRGCVLPPP